MTGACISFHPAGANFCRITPGFLSHNTGNLHKLIQGKLFIRKPIQRKPEKALSVILSTRQGGALGLAPAPAGKWKKNCRP